MNINAKQMTEIATSRMDITTVLGYFGQIRSIVTQNSPLVGALSTVWTTFTGAVEAFDTAYAQARKWAQTADIETLDQERDAALSAYLNAQKAMLASPNAAKAQGARLLQFVRDKYSLSPSNEYMKETTAIQQFVQELETTADAQAALTATGLDDWLQDLKQKNQAFLAKMNERTEAQAGQEKGIVREKRLLAEAAYKDVVKLINAAAIMEIPAGLDYTTAINLLNAEVDHYRQILARKGVSTGTNTGGDGTGGTDSGDTGSSGGSTGGSGNSGGSGGGSDTGSGGGSTGGSGDSGGGGLVDGGDTGYE